jgi:hypothetical protein
MLDTKTIIDKIENIANIHKHFKLSEIGEIRYQDYSQSILAIESYKKVDANTLIVAGIHGDEPAGVLATMKVLETLTSRPMSKGHTIIPCVNPWGRDHHSRVNGAGRDINRDFWNPKTQEAAAVIRYLSGKEFDLVLDLHEDPESRRGAYLYCLAQSAIMVEKAENAIHQMHSFGLPIERRLKTLPFQKRSGLVHIPYWASTITKLVRVLSFCNYCRIMGISENIVVTETPTCISLDRRVELQLLSIQTLSEQGK